MASNQPPAPQQPPSLRHQDANPVNRFKALVPQLRESVRELLTAAAASLAREAPADGARRVGAALEEFYALCDELEVCLRLAHECLSQSADSFAHSPTLVRTAIKPDAGAPSEVTSYACYLSSVRTMVSCVEEVRKALLECCKKVTAEGQHEGNP